MKYTHARHLQLRKLRKKAGEIILRPKELEFLLLCCQDITYEQMARRLKKSVRTIEGRRNDLFYLLDVSSRTGLVLWCFKTGLMKVKNIRLEKRKKKKPRQE
jgi:DNA-binding CsgD family transcriptional regulator